jgi:hypothetical protein
MKTKKERQKKKKKKLAAAKPLCLERFTSPL